MTKRTIYNEPGQRGAANLTSERYEITIEDDIRWQFACWKPGCPNVVNVPKQMGYPAATAIRDDGTIDRSRVEWRANPKPMRAPGCIDHPHTR